MDEYLKQRYILTFQAHSHEIFYKMYVLRFILQCHKQQRRWKYVYVCINVYVSVCAVCVCVFGEVS